MLNGYMKEQGPALPWKSDKETENEKRRQEEEQKRPKRLEKANFSAAYAWNGRILPRRIVAAAQALQKMPLQVEILGFLCVCHDEFEARFGVAPHEF